MTTFGAVCRDLGQEEEDLDHEGAARRSILSRMLIIMRMLIMMKS